MEAQRSPASIVSPLPLKKEGGGWLSGARSEKIGGAKPQLTVLSSLHSTIARSFSAELEDIFRIDSSVADLDAKLDERCVT